MDGSVDPLCDVVSGECRCKENFSGLKCDTVEGSSKGCAVPNWKGDSYCDDDNNTAACDWDGGDCCGGNTQYCSECKCLDPNV